jgi:hypothetical protein
MGAIRVVRMPISGIRQIREIFSTLLPAGYSLRSAYMAYDHQSEVESQVLTFHVIDPSGITHVIKSDMVPAKTDVGELARNTAKTFVGRLNNGTPDGNDEPDRGQRPDSTEDQKDPDRYRGPVPWQDGVDETGEDGIPGNGPEAA